MTIRFNSLVLIPSDHCNISCRHCYPDCGPQSKSSWDVGLLKTCISDAAKISELGKVVHFAGGEPFLYFKDLLGLMQHAQAEGFVSSVVTNAFWASNPKRAAYQIRSLVQAGLIRVEVSADIFHQEFIPITTISSAIRVLKGEGVRVVLRVVTTRSHMIDETLKSLTAEDLDGIEVSGSPMVPVGRALTAGSREEHYLSKQGSVGSCADILNLTVRPDGNVSPCCAGSDVTPSLSLGNIRKDSIDVIVARLRRNYLIRKLVFQGPSSFFPWLSEENLGDRIKDSYTNICHACSELFLDVEVVDVARRRINDMQQNHLVSMMSQLGGIDYSMPVERKKQEPDNSTSFFISVEDIGKMTHNAHKH